MKILILIFFFLILPKTVLAFENINQNQIYTFDSLNQNKIGVSASIISGIGLSFNNKMSDNFAIELTGLIYSNQWFTNKKYDGIISYIFGFEFQYFLLFNHEYEFYCAIGTGMMYDAEIENMKNKSIYQIKSFGFGLGFNYLFYKNFSMNFKPSISFREHQRGYIEMDYKHYNVCSIELGFGIYYTF